MKFFNLKNLGLATASLILVLMLFSPFSLSRADTASPVVEEFSFVYLFHLYYDNGQLFADRDFEFKYDLIAEPFVQSKVDSATPHKGEVISLLGNVEGTFQFDPTITKGKIKVKGPYFSDARKVNFYDPKGELLLAIDVFESSVCNDDNVCNSEYGEDRNNCPNDCKVAPIPEPTGGPGELNLTRLLMIGGGAVVVILAAWLIIRSRRKRRAILELPNIQPPSSTPPAPPSTVSPLPPTMPEPPVSEANQSQIKQ